jgi:ankyrin repeat protein
MTRFLQPWRKIFIAIVLAGCAGFPANAQTPPTQGEIAAYSGLHRAAAAGDVAAIQTLKAQGVPVDARDGNGRTPFIVAAFLKQHGAMRALAAAGADVNALDSQIYDAVTIAAVADDPETMSLAISLGNKATNITSRYVGTALIAAAHLGHDEVVRRLIAAGAPLDHVNNLGWTALIEAVVLGDGGPRHVASAEALLKAGAKTSIGDRSGVTPLVHAERRGFTRMAQVIRAAGGK